MDKYDKNNDAKIDIKEFANLVTAIDKKLPEDELKMMFEYLDSDKNGLISVSELKPILYWKNKVKMIRYLNKSAPYIKFFGIS